MDWVTIEHLTSQNPKIPIKHAEVLQPGPINIIILTNLWEEDNDPFGMFEESVTDKDIINQRFTIVNFHDEKFDIRRPT